MAKKPAKAGSDADAAPKGGGKKKLVIIVVALLAVGGAAYFFLLKPDSGKKEKPVAGEVVALEPRQLNLEGGHYLKLGLALQGTDSVAHGIDGSKALDAAIEIFSGRSVEELSDHEELHHLKKELKKELDHLYHGDVMDVYFTDFVTQ
jgi:flagellar protein FliL